MQLNKNLPIFFAKTDVQSAFRLVPLNSKSYPWLVLKVKHPLTGKTYFFVDKNLPFGSSISCSHFQRFSNALRHIFEHRMGRQLILTNYLDDYLIVQNSEKSCNELVRQFLKLTEQLNIPMSEEKTEWASMQVVFLGILLDGKHRLLVVPEDKQLRAVNWLKLMTNKRKATIGQLQSLAGLLNFMNKAVYPGRAFTRRMYAKFSGDKFQDLKKFHHVSLDREFHDDCKVWLEFLTTYRVEAVSRPFIDCGEDFLGNDIRYTSDTSAAVRKGFGCVLKTSWMFGQWPKNFMLKYEPCIEFLELFALCIGIFSWIEQLRNDRIIIYCDNQTVCRMVNHNTSGCKYCMVLIRKLTLLCLCYNLKIHVEYIKSRDNELSDALSRINLKLFKDLTRELDFDPFPTCPSMELWPVDVFGRSTVWTFKSEKEL